MSRKVCQVLVTCPISKPYTYLVPEDAQPAIGDVVIAPFRNRQLSGVVIEVNSLQSAEKLKTISPIPYNFKPEFIKFLEWVAEYNLIPVGMVLKMALGNPKFLEPAKSLQRYVNAEYNYTPVSLSPEQMLCAEQILAADKFVPFLLDGVTGSGKTEVYFHSIAETLQQKKQCLIMLPEIGLSNQWLSRFKSRFGVEPHVWHSDTPLAKKRHTWQSVINGTAGVVVGARSALFLPFKSLGLIVVDEEHDQAYKQEEQGTYNARDMAVVRASMEAVPIVLASATPSVEAFNNVQSGKYQLLELPNRHAQATLPQANIIDMRAHKCGKNSWLSEPLLVAIEQAIARKEQALLFLNRRGFAPLTLCTVCGDKVACLGCTSWLVEHKKHNSLICHQCGYTRPVPKNCQKCGGEYTACGPGVERVFEEVQMKFPDARIATITSDTVAPKEYQQLLQHIENGAINIIIGTQMIAKGYHFPHLTVIGIVDADMGLEGSDLRACERSYQLLHQVAGRAGRESKQGHVYIQTYNPEHPVINAITANDRSTFITMEMASRRLQGMPPFGSMIGVIVSALNEQDAERAARLLVRHAPSYADVQFLGPAPAVLSKLRSRYRFRILVRSETKVKLQPIVKAWLAGMKPNNAVRIQVDVDPYSFY
jgi:primosomal protein N' (replication factor Y)